MPPPPLQIDLRGVHTIGVTVINESERHRLDAARMIGDIVTTANYRSRETRVRMRAHRDGKDEDAELKLVILKERAFPVRLNRPGTPLRWSVGLETSATLTARSGRVIWQDEMWEWDAHANLAAANEAECWQSVSLPWVSSWFSVALVERMFYGESQ